MTPRKSLRGRASRVRIDTAQELSRVAEALDKAPVASAERFELLRRQAELGDLRDERVVKARRARRDER